MSRKRKIIMLGCKGYQRSADDVIVDCFSWDDISKIKNIRDGKFSSEMQLHFF